ncbi:MAG: glycosyltransferase family 39 protein, partial [Thaumarchaeota archaeon]|nr:glycosyltransferase family 39 protein [Nitrososphaerota archaeon]
MKAWLRREAWIENKLCVLLFGFGCLLRLLYLGSVPGGLNQDEASTGYDAWALLHAGIDRNGFSWPVQFISWGSGQNALYAWLSLPFIAIGGLSVLSVRFAMALAGVAALVLFWRLGQRAGGKFAGFSALLVLALNPWHIMASRWALESNILPFVVLCAVALLAESTSESCARPRTLLVVSAVILGMSVYAYGPAYLFTPVFLVASLLLLRVKARLEWRMVVVATVTTAVVALPMLVFVLNNRFGTRSLQLGPISWPHYTGPARFDSIFLPFSPRGRAKLGENVVTCFRLLGASSDDGLSWNSIPGFGPLLPMSLPFMVWGLMGMWKKPRRTVDLLMFVWFVVAMLVGMMTDANINRINLVWFPAIWLVARGLEELKELPVLFRSASAVFFATACCFAWVYFGAWNEKISESFSYGFGPALKASIA